MAEEQEPIREEPSQAETLDDIADELDQVFNMKPPAPPAEPTPRADVSRARELAAPTESVLETAAQSVGGALDQVQQELQAQDVYFNSEEFRELEQDDPGTAALQLMRAQERRQYLGAVESQLSQKAQGISREALSRRREDFTRECQSCIPDWNDRGLMQREIQGIRKYARANGWTEDQLERVWDVPTIRTLRDGYLAHEQKNNPSPRKQRRAGLKLRKSKGDQFTNAFNQELSKIEKTGRRGTNARYSAASRALKKLGIEL